MEMIKREIEIESDADDIELTDVPSSEYVPVTFVGNVARSVLVSVVASLTFYAVTEHLVPYVQRKIKEYKIRKARNVW